MSTTATVAIVYTMPTGKRTIGRVHRETCKHIPKTAVVIPGHNADLDALFDATLATCCSVKSADVKAFIAERQATDAADTGRPVKGPAEQVADVVAKRDAAIAANEAKAKPAKAVKPKADAKPKGRPAAFASWTPTDAEPEHKCGGKCATVKAAKSFPTTATPGVRGGECRSCRDARKAA